MSNSVKRFTFCRAVKPLVRKSAYLFAVLVLFSGLAVIHAQSSRNPIPFVNQPLVPMSAAPGGAGFTLTVNGTGFVSSSVVNWNGATLATTFVSSSQVTAAVTPADIATAVTASITVTNPAPGGGVSNVMYFPVANEPTTPTFAQLDSQKADGTAMVAGDFNGDGKVDLASEGPLGNPAGICVQPGVGDGTFGAPICSPEARLDPTFMVVGDFNGDGKLDIVASNMFTNTISVLLGNGDGTFQPQVKISVGSSDLLTEGIAVGDFNGDGKLDLAVVSIENGGTANEMEIFLGNGDGTFQPFKTYSLPMGDSDLVAVGDFNGDGKLDLVTNEVILLGNGDGTFQPAQAIPGNVGGGVIPVDLNGDGKLDLIMPGFVLLGNGNGTFNSTPINYNYPNLPGSVVIGDFNGDGKVDIAEVLPSTQNSTVAILLGNGDGSFQNPINFTVGPDAGSLVAADFNGDGKLDLALMPQAGSPTFVNLAVLLQGNLPALTVSPPFLSFGVQTLGGPAQPQAVTVTNTGTATVNFSEITINGTDAGQFQQTNNCGASLATSASCQVNVKFVPASTASADASLVIKDNGIGNPQIVSLTGGPPAAAVSLSPTSLTFPTQYSGTSGLPQNVSLMNTGNVMLTISNVEASPSDFGVLNTCGASVAAGASCSIGVFFDPTAAGTRTGTLTITDNAGDSPQTVSLSGTGKDFTLGASSASATVSPGETAKYTISVSPGGGFNQTVALSCSGGPSQSTCSVSPNTLVLNGSSASTATVSVAVPSSAVGVGRPASEPGSFDRLSVWVICWGTSLLALAAMYFGGRGKQRRRWAYLVSILVVLSAGLVMSACGGGGGGSSGSNGTTYSVTVTGSSTVGSTTLTHNTKLTLIVE